MAPLDRAGPGDRRDRSGHSQPASNCAGGEGAHCWCPRPLARSRFQVICRACAEAPAARPGGPRPCQPLFGRERRSGKGAPLRPWPPRPSPSVRAASQFSDPVGPARNNLFSSDMFEVLPLAAKPCRNTNRSGGFVFFSVLSSRYQRDLAMQAARIARTMLLLTFRSFRCLGLDDVPLQSRTDQVRIGPGISDLFHFPWRNSWREEAHWL